MITTLKQDSKRFEIESAQRRQRSGQSGIKFSSSNTFDERQRQRRQDGPQSEYVRYGADITMDAYDGGPGAIRTYRDQESRTYSDMVDIREDPGQQLPIYRHGLPVSRGYPQDPAYRSSYRVQPVSSGYYGPESTQVRTLGPNSTPPPRMGRSDQAIYGGSYSSFFTEASDVPVSAAYPASYSAIGYPSSTPPNSASTNIGQPVPTPYGGYQAGARHPGWGDTPNFTKSTGS